LPPRAKRHTKSSNRPRNDSDAAAALKKTTEAEIAALRRKIEEEIEKERATFATERYMRTAELDAREAKLKEAQAQLEAEAAAVAKLKAKFDRKMAALEAA